MSASMLPPEVLREIRARTPLAAVVGRNVRLTRAGRRHWKSCCPFHGEKTPSFHVYDDGHYHCFGCGAHGDAISYVMQMEGVGFRAAAQQLARDAGMSLPDTSPPACEQEAADRRAARLAARQAEYARQAAEREAKAAREFAADVQRARDYIASLPHYLGTLGERSLHVMRGVPRAAWSDAIRYDPARRCLVYIATDDAGDVQGGQQVFLERDGRNRRRFNRRGSFKLTIGHPRAGKAAVRLAGDAAWAVAIGEGVENTAVVAGALGIAGHAALGPFTTIEPPVGVLTIAVLDGDAPDSAAAIAQADWIERWRSEGRHIVPVSARDWTGQKFDFADLVASAGVNAVRQRIQAALLEHQGLAPADPPRLLPNASVADARAALVRFTREAFSPSDDGLPRQTLIGGEGGIGKTETVGQYMPHAMLQAKQAGRPWRIIYMVPEHVNLGPQVAERFARLGLDVFRLEGRGDPFAIAPVRKPRCGNMPAVAEAIRAGQSVREAVCGTPKGKHCTLFHTCHDDGYLGDLRRAAEADVLVVAHAYLINHLPEQVRHDVGWLVIDEDFTASLDYVRSLTIETFTRAAIERFPVLTNGERDALSTAKLGHLTELIERAVAGATDDYVPAAALRAVGLTVHDCEVAAKLTWQRKIDVAMTPETDLRRRKEMADQVPINRQLHAIAAVWHGLRAVLADGADGAGRISLTTQNTRKGTWREIIVHTQKRLAPWLDDLPVIMLGATTGLDDVRRCFPRTILRAPPHVATPHAFTRLIPGGFGKRMSAKRQRGLGVWHQVWNAGREQSVVIHKCCAEALVGVPSMRVVTHGANAGDDELRDVEAHSVIGGISLPPPVVAAIAAARSGRAVAPARAVMTAAPVLMRDGTGKAVRVRSYEDPDAQAVHHACHHGSVMQAATRPRQVGRTAADPVETNIFGHEAPDMPINEIRSWRDFRVDRLWEMVARRRVYSNAAHMHAVYPDLFKTDRAATDARASMGDIRGRLRELADRDPAPWSEIEFQPRGQGNHVSRVWCPASDVDGMHTEVAARFGEPVHWRVSAFTHGRVPIQAQEVIRIDVPQLKTEPRTTSPSIDVDVPQPWRIPEADASWRAERPPDE